MGEARLHEAHGLLAAPIAGISLGREAARSRGGGGSPTSRTPSSSARATWGSSSAASSCSTRRRDQLVGFVDAEPKERRADLEHLTLLGPPERLATIVEVFDVERVLIAFSNASHEEMLELIRSLKDLDVQIDLVPRLFDVVTPSVGIHTVEAAADRPAAAQALALVQASKRAST